MQIDALLKRLDSVKTDRKKTNLYLSESIYKQFKRRISPRAVSRALEEMMRSACEEQSKQNKR